MHEFHEVGAKCKIFGSLEGLIRNNNIEGKSKTIKILKEIK